MPLAISIKICETHPERTQRDLLTLMTTYRIKKFHIFGEKVVVLRPCYLQNDFIHFFFPV